MSEQNRADRFREEIEEMKLKTTTTGADRAMQTIGLLAMLGSIVGGFVIWSSSTKAGALDQTELVVLSGALICIGIFGAALFIVGAMRQFLRFWMLRMLYEQG